MELWLGRWRPMNFRVLFLILIVACAGCLGGAGEEQTPAGRSAISQMELAKGPFPAPADGKLTAEMVEHYIETLQETRAQLVADGNEGLCAPDWKGDAKASKRRARTISTARNRAQMAVGMNNSKWYWTQKAIRQARLYGRTKRGDAATKANFDFLAAHEEALQEAEAGLK